MREAQKTVARCQDVGKPATYPPLGPYPVPDVVGMGPAMDMLLRSLEPGHYEKYFQLDAVPDARSTFSNLWHDLNSGSWMEV